MCYYILKLVCIIVGILLTTFSCNCVDWILPNICDTGVDHHSPSRLLDYFIRSIFLSCVHSIFTIRYTFTCQNLIQRPKIAFTKPLCTSKPSSASPQPRAALLIILSNITTARIIVKLALQNFILRTLLPHF